MKKILITLFALAVLTCLFVVGVSAAAYDEKRTTIEYTDFEDNTHTVPVVKYEVEVSTVNSAIMADTSRGHMCHLKGLTDMADNSALCILEDTDGNLTAYPSWYIIDADGTAIYEIGYGYLNSISETTNKSYEEGAIVYMEFPQGMSYVRNNGVFCQKQTNKAYEPNVTEFHIPKTVTYIDQAFNSMKKLESVYIEKGSKITQIKSGAFSNSTVKYVQIENCTELTSIDGFTSCGITGDLDFSKSKLVTINAGCFQNSKNIGKITLPDTVETIAASAFENCGSAYLASPYLPANLKSIGARFFAYNSNLLDTYIFPEGVTQLLSEPFQDSKVAGGPSGKELNLVFLGEVTGIVYLNGNGHQKHAEKVTVYFAKNSLSDYNQNGFYIKPSGSSTTSVPGAIRAAFCEGTYANVDGKITGIEYVYITSTTGASYTADMVNDADYGYDFANHSHLGPRLIKQALTCGTDGIDTVRCIICDVDQDKITPATGDHKLVSDQNCETDDLCGVCRTIMVEAISHTLVNELLYGNGYTKAGVERDGCTNDGCSFANEKEIPALFTSKGYSLDTKSTAIVLDISVNNGAIDNYKAYLEKIGEDSTIAYGVAASINANDGKLLDDNGDAKSGTLAIRFNENTYSNIQTKILGIKEESYDIGIYCSAYFYMGGSVKYISGEETSDFAQTVTYNSLLDE